MKHTVGLYIWCASWWLYDHKLPGHRALHRAHCALWDNDETWTRAEVMGALMCLGYGRARAWNVARVAGLVSNRPEPVQ